MLEGLVANLLNRFLGMYVKNFDPKQLNVGIWSGDVKLRNLELRREALDQLHLPLNVVQGHLGQLTLRIPWSNLRGSPVHVSIEDVFLLAAPKEDAEYDAEEEETRAHAVKMEKLDSAELLKERNTEGMSAEEQKKNQSFTASLVTTIVDNLQVSVKNIHIRYEDAISHPGHAFALGITLEEFSAVSTDGDWKPTFIQGSSASSHKLATLGSLAVYWDTDASLMGTGKGEQIRDEEQGLDREEFIKKAKQMIVRGDSPDLAEHQFILKPVSGRAGLEIDKTGKPGKPKVKARLLFDELGFIIDEDQYRDALMLVELFHYFIRHQEYKKFEPKSRPAEDPLAWLQFAGKAVLDKIHDRNRKWSWDYFRERRDDRLRYIALFKKKKKEEKLTPDEAKEMDALERKLSYEDLRFWRSLARNQLRKENIGVPKHKETQSWGAWIWGSKPQNQEEETDITEEDRKKLYDAIDWDEQQQLSDAIDMPREYVKMQVEMSLRTGSFTLRRDPHGRCGKPNNILRLLFDNFSTKALQRTDSMLIELSLDGMRLYDGTTDGSLFEQIIIVKGVAPVADEDRIRELNDDETEPRLKGDHDEDDRAEDGDPFFQVAFEKNPLDGSADTALNVRLKGMEIVYNPKFIAEVAKFFKPPERHMESIGALMETAGATVEGIRQQTRAGLEFALEEHKTINTQLDLQAPLIIIPDSVTDSSTICLIIDAGHVSVSSDLVDKSTIRDIQNKHSKQYTEADFKQLEGLMYDKFILKLESTQVLIGTSIEETKSQLDEKSTSKSLHLVDRINMDFTIETCIIQRAADLTKFRISGNLPVLHASVSDSKYKSLMRLIDVAIPRFDENENVKQLQNETTGPSNLDPLIEIRERNGSSVGRTRAKSFTKTSQRKEILVGEEGSESEQDDFQDASDKKAAPERNIHQRNFEFKFTVDKLQGSLYRSDPDGKKPDELLVELVAQGFNLDFYQEEFSMVAEVSLKTLAVQDHVEENPLPEFRNLISSEDTDTALQKDLFQLKFIRVNEDSPEFNELYQGVAMNLDVMVSTINLIVTRKTLLTLLDFVLVTFTNSSLVAQDKSVEDSPDGPMKEDKKGPESQEPDKIRIKARLKRIALILNNDGIRLATLSLNAADVGVFLAGKAMRVDAKLGNLSLIDDVNQGVSEQSSLRQLVTIQGKELADFSYETFDANTDNYPGYDSSIYLRSGSLKVNFLTEPFRKIMEFGVKFGKMQAIFNAARQAAANQANQIQESAGKMHFDIIIRTPIVVFPRMVITEKPERDTLTANLGEIYANNKFVPLDDSKMSDFANKLTAGVRNIKLTSNLHYDNDQVEELELIDKVNLDFNITLVEHKQGYKRPDVEIEGNMSDINLRLTQEQLKLALELSRSIPEAFATEPAEELEGQAMDELEESALRPSRRIAEYEETTPKSKNITTKQVSELGKSEEDKWAKLDLIFKIGAVGLELIQARTVEPVGDLESASLSKFSLSDTNIKTRMMSDGSLEAELLIQSFSIRDSRSQTTNKFRKIMSLTNTEVKQQFMASLSISGNEDKHLIAILTIDSPRVILALDYLFALQGFVSAGLMTDDILHIEDQDEDIESESTVSVQSGALSSIKKDGKAETRDEKEPDGMTISFRVNLVDAQIILLANPAINNSEAIVLGTKQVLVSKQNSTTLQVEKVGMFLCRMDKFDSTRLRILDDFSVTTSLDMRSQGEDSSLTSIHVDVEPLILRLSLRDILLAMQIFNRASAMQTPDQQTVDDGPKNLKQVKANDSTSRSKSSHKKATSTHARGKSATSIKTGKKTDRVSAITTKQQKASTVMKREEMKVSFEGLRVVLIGDAHELPMLDWRVHKFNVDVRDWSAAMTADTNIDTLFNIYNFSKSAWEPLIEPWSVGFHMSKEQSPDKLGVELFSRKALELSITTATIALASKSADFLSTEEDVLSKPRGMDAPYRIRNYTGFDINVWADSKDNEEGPAAKLDDGEERPWRFEDPTTTRETLSPEGALGILGVKLEGSGFDSVTRIQVSREGENLYNLKPRKDRVQHRLLVEVKLGTDNVKYITFRSPLLVENNTQIPIEIGIYNPEEGHILKIEKIAPGDARPAPVGAAYMHSIIIRPDQGFGYAWSNERLFWQDSLKRPNRTITCKGDSDQSSPPFFFQSYAQFDKRDPLTSIYPYMRIRLHAPVEVQNLLPYDFKYRIYDDNTKKDWANFLRNGGVSPVHVVELSHLLLINVYMQDTPFKQSKFAVINSSGKDDFRREKTIEVKDDKDLSLRLSLHYYKIPDSGGAFKVTIYSPYVILNRTGLELDVRSKQFMGQAKAAAGQAVFVQEEDEDAQKAHPFMFSFPTDDKKNRALLKVGDSQWSKPQSFDAIGSAYDVSLTSGNGCSEMHIGINVAEGEGKYNLCKVVTIAPRFIVKNRMKEDISIREPGSSNIMTLRSGQLQPLRYLRQSVGQQLSLCFPGVSNQWSSAFDIANVGNVHVKLAKNGKRQQLVRVDILMEGATIFLQLSIETKHWPFSMRNESDTEFLFYQANPNVDEDEEDRGSGWRPIRYRLPPRSVMPYAWDHPAAKNKEIILTANGRERHVRLAEIGNLIPMRLPPTPEVNRQKVIDLNVIADGPTQTLILSTYKPSKSLYKQKSASASQSTTSGFEVKEQDTDVTFKATLRLAGIGVSLVNAQLRELVYLTLRDIELKYSESALFQTLGLTIKWMQIDNQLYGGIFPILFYPSVVPKTGREMEAHPILHATLSRVKDDSYGVIYIKYFTILLQQMTLEIDEDFIFALLDFTKIPGASWSEEKQGKLCDERLELPEPQQEQSGQDVYFELLHLQPMQFDLSFVRTERINAEDTATSSNPFMFAVNVLTMSIGNVNDAPVRYNALMLENARVSMTALISNVRSHYVQESLRQVHIVLGSADFLGNPVGLFNNISSGVADIFYEPYQGLVMTDRPQELGIGIAKGASSFVKKSVFGFSDSMAKFTGSISKGLSAASMDKEFQDQRRMSRSRNRPKHALYGITSGGNAFASSLASGIGGLARHPIQGAEKEGVAGFMKGVGKGVLGLATKPAIGAFDLASNMAEGVRNTTTVFDQEGLDRVRLTRFIGRDGVVRPYSQREALGQFWLKTLDNGKWFNEDYVAHLELGSSLSPSQSAQLPQSPARRGPSGNADMLVMLTYNTILLVRTKKLTTEWDVPLKDVATISKERTGISISLKGGTNGPFIPVQDEGSRNWFYGQVAVAVNAFNEKWSAKS
ncbi:vacuolar protein sorting-associated protein 13 [Pseudovirgaria hyperparasitica]|uniref:Vacuolar protein sorting-associated protein 13 n=1 Tax=Pseudovirgaria hyperparasitica TaxID=470096 RepID=A0A6A6VXQ2_9PEZI|nr:vacuolar protein sorting-associated protein 13 [Pseudovirgaria hyperparasitica]KAF2754047.1 vacuolar protein sorting-associated protein 13 [Pseudovirgaria hyperparasitica]